MLIIHYLWYKECHFNIVCYYMSLEILKISVNLKIINLRYIIILQVVIRLDNNNTILLKNFLQIKAKQGNSLVVVSESSKECHFIDFKERPYEQQIEILLEQKLYDKVLEKLLANITEEDNKRQEKAEILFLDCAWLCLEGNKKNYENSFEFMNL